MEEWVDFRAWIPESVAIVKKTIIRTGLETLYFSGMHHWLRPLLGGVGAILTLHHVRPPRPEAFQPNRLLEVSPVFFEGLLRRLKRRSTSDRPLLNTDKPAETLERLVAERYPIYGEADVSVQSVEGVAAEHDFVGAAGDGVSQDAVEAVAGIAMLEEYVSHRQAPAGRRCAGPARSICCPPARAMPHDWSGRRSRDNANWSNSCRAACKASPRRHSPTLYLQPWLRRSRLR